MFIAINKITCPAEMADHMVERFASSEGLKDTPGVVRFELLQRTWLGMKHGETENTAEDDGLVELLSMTHWESEEAFHDWTRSDSFKKAHSKRGNADEQKAHAEAAKRVSSQASGYELKVYKVPSESELVMEKVEV